MSLSKKQMVGIGCGCAFLVVTGLLGYMFYDAYSERSAVEQGGETVNDEGEPEDVEGLEAAKEAIRGYYNAPIFPSKKAQASVRSNETVYAQWCEDAIKVAARGDMPPLPPESPSVFRQRLSAEADRLRALQGGVSGRIAKPEFYFGFDQYLGPNGVLPQSADVPRLAVQLATISRVVEHCAEAGALEVTEIKRIEASAEEDDDSGRRSTQGAKKKDAPAEMPFAPDGSKLEYRFKVNARPAAIVQILNSIAADTRFMVVKNFSLRETADMIMNNIGSRNKAREEAASGGTARPSRRRARRGMQQPEEAASANATAAPAFNRLVVDPELDEPIELDFTLAVYDFGFGKAAAPADEPATDAPAGNAPAANTPAAPTPVAADPAAAAEGKESK